MDDSERQRFEAQRDASMVQRLFKAARLLNELGIARVRAETGFAKLRTTHFALLPHIDLEGTRLTELARRVGVSKQAVGQLVDELVEMGSLERAPDPSDGRAKLIRFARNEGRDLFAGLAVLEGIERELGDVVGSDNLRYLHGLLGDILTHLGAPPCPRGGLTPAASTPAGPAPARS